MRLEQVLVLEDEPLLRSVLCEVLEESIPGLRSRPAATRREASALLEEGEIGQVVSEVTLGGANISLWLGSMLARRPHLSLVTFSTQRPWLPSEFHESPRVIHVEKRGVHAVQRLVFACRELLR